MHSDTDCFGCTRLQEPGLSDYVLAFCPSLKEWYLRCCRYAWLGAGCPAAGCQHAAGARHARAAGSPGPGRAPHSL